MSTTTHAPIVGPRVTEHPSSTSRWPRGLLLLALLAGIAMLWSAGQAHAAPIFDVSVTHSPDHVAKNDRAFDYQVALTNSGSAGAVQVGDHLTCTTGTWYDPPPSFGYQWLRNGTPVPGAESNAYTVVVADEDQALQCDVTATNSSGSIHVITPATFVGITPQTPPRPPDGRLGGWDPNAPIGSEVSCSPGDWDGTPSPAFTYQWYRNGESLGAADGAQTDTYTVQAEDGINGHPAGLLQCRVKGTNADGAVIGYSGATDPFPRTQLGPQISTGEVSVSLELPSGVALREPTSGGPDTRLHPNGWSCSTASMPIVCSRSDAPAAGVAYPPIHLGVRLGADAPETLTATATVSGGGAPTATGTDTFTLDSAKPFGVDSFTTSVVDDGGNNYTQASGHPFTATTTFDFASIRSADLATNRLPVEDAKTVITKLPPGFIGNPQAVRACDSTALRRVTCAPESQVGTAFLVLNGGTGGQAGVYNVTPTRGHAAEFAFQLGGIGVVHIYADLRSDEDYGITITAPDATQAQLLHVSLTFWGTPADPRHDAERYTCPADNSRDCVGGTPSEDPPVPFLTNPATLCTDKPPVTTLSVDSWQHPGVFKDYFAVSPLITGCDKLTFEPSVDVAPSTTAPDKPTGLDMDLKFPTEDNAEGLASPALKKAVVTLPEGMTINPAGANGLQACGDAALQLKSLDPTKCPDTSKIGTVTAKSPVLKETLSGGVYIRSQNSMDPESGEMFRIALVLENKERGISIRLPGSIRADKDTGRLVTTFDNNPELPVESIKLQFKDGPRAPLATPATCGKKTVDTVLTSWGKQTKALSSTFNVDCTAGLGWFGPYFSAGTISPQAGASSPFALRVSKPDGQSDLNGIALSLPEGLLANLKGNVGTRIGTARVAAGPGSSPFWLEGPVVLEGPYGGAPFSLRVTVPAVAGPFNLGNVVVRQKIYVDPHDAHVTVVSDSLPTIVKGVPVRLQSLNVDVDKPGFMINPTSCAVKSIGGTLAASTGQTASVASRFQVGGCQNLPLAPKLSLDLIGKKEIKRGKHPKLSTTLTQKPGESGLKKVAVRLPLSLALDPDNAQALCKPEQAAAKACPAESIIGKATAISPVLNRPLTGDVYFVEGTRQTEQGRTAKTMPKLWVALRGEVALDVWADSSLEDSKYLVTTFGFIPDAPISSFKLDIDGGKHGILVVTGKSDANLCQKPLVAKAQFDGQNGKRVKSHPVMGSPCRFRVQDKTLYSTRAKVRVSGIGAGKLTLSGKGVKTTRRTIKRADVASITAKLTSTGKRAYKGRKAIRLKVSFNPSAKGEKTHSLRTTVKRAKAKKKKSASARSHLSR